jgi:hypothetical protein
VCNLIPRRCVLKNTTWSKELAQGTLNVSTLMVMQSNAGYYIGRSCLETDEDSDDYCGGMHEPYSRESEYYPTEQAATKAFTEGHVVRDCVENNYAYEQGTLSLKAE